MFYRWATESTSSVNVSHQATLLASCSVYRTLQHISSLAHASLSHLLHEELHWLDVPERIHCKLGVTVHRCLLYKALEYLVDFCTPVWDIPSRRHLGSTTGHHLTIPCYRLSTFGRWAFSVAGLTVWNSLPDSLHDLALTSNSFRQSLKTNLFRRYHSAHTAQ